MRRKSTKGSLVGSILIKVKSGMANASSRLARGSPAFTRWNVVRVLVIGVLMSAGAAIYFDLVSEGAASTPTTEQNLEATPIKVATRYRGAPIDDDEWRSDSPYYDDFRPESGAVLSREGIAVYSRDDDEWLYDSPFHREWAEFSAEEFNQAATSTAPSYHKQRVADSLEERQEVQRVRQKILGE